MFHFATSQTHFLFDNKIFDQIDAVAMGSPLAPTLANLFMGHHEQNWLGNSKASNVLFYKRYVDDIFCFFESEEHVELFFDFINAQHENIRFTYEKEENNKLPFLDIFINTANNEIGTSVLGKKLTPIINKFL